MSAEIQLVGGLGDGARYSLETLPPEIYVEQVDPAWNPLQATAGDVMEVPHIRHVYRPGRDDGGQLARNAAGEVLYRLVS